MWATLAMTAALSFAPQQATELTITNVRPTYCLYGAPRKDAAAAKLLPGDVFYVSFDIEGLKVGPDGLIKYSTGMELTKGGKIQFAEKPVERTSYNSLGGSRVPAFVATQLGTDTPPGKYAITATVIDLANNKATKKITSEFEVLPKDFGLVRFSLNYPSQDLIPAPPLGVPGQALLVGFAAAGFKRDEKTKMPHVKATMRVLEGGKPVLQKDTTGEAKNVQADFSLIPMTFLLNLNRAGKFTVELTITDELASPKKKASHTFEIVVQEPKTK